MKTSFFGITWASAQYVIYFPLILVMIALIVLYYHKKQQAVALLTAAQWRSLLITHYSAQKNWYKVFFLSLALVALFLALLQPQWDKQEEQIKQQGRDLIIALDVSRSMLAQDIKPNRLTFAKEKIKALMHALASERISLVLFSGEPIVQCPLTTDYAAFMLFLDQIDSETISSGTTALDRVLQKVLALYKEQLTTKNKALVVFTDGEDFSSNLAAVKEEAKMIGLPIITVGVGTPEGAPIPIVDDNGRQVDYQRDEHGAIVMSQLNEGILMSLADGIGGAYVLADAHDTNDVKKIVRSIEYLEKAAFDEKKVSSLQDHYLYFVLVSFVCFLIAWLL